MATCYRHPNRETGVSCSSCGRPICPDCMTPTSVGMRCPECSRDRARVTRGVRSTPALPRGTQALLVINVIVFLAETAAGAPLGGGGGGTVWYHGALYGVGSALEPAIGTRYFLVVYMTSLLAGSFGALRFQPGYPAIGASGAIF